MWVFILYTNCIQILCTNSKLLLCICAVEFETFGFQGQYSKRHNIKSREMMLLCKGIPRQAKCMLIPSLRNFCSTPLARATESLSHTSFFQKSQQWGKIHQDLMNAEKTSSDSSTGFAGLNTPPSHSILQVCRSYTVATGYTLLKEQTTTWKYSLQSFSPQLPPLQRCHPCLPQYTKHTTGGSRF